MTERQAYDKLREHFLESTLIGSAAMLLGWDQRTMIPAKGHEHRSNQLATLARLTHARRTDPRVGEWLARVEGTELVADPLSAAAVNVREWRRDFDRRSRVPETLAVEIARAASRCESTWEEARPLGAWDVYRPCLERILALKLEEASCLGYPTEPYDALIDDFEPGETAASIEPVLQALKAPLVELIGRIMDSRRRPDPSILRRKSSGFPIEAQASLVRQVTGLMGYDLAAGRVDTTAHPFSTRIGPGDVRITLRYNESDLSQALFSALHEAGHALYSQGQDQEHYGSPMGESVSLAVHESQSRLWENFVGRSLGFWRHVLPLARERFPELAHVSPETFHLAVNEVRPSLIRTEADEVTYNLHVMLRFELELALTRGEMRVADLPEAWRERMREFLGIEPEGEENGVMQDVHWSAGLFGYFPTYTLGNVYAAQLFDAARRELGDLEAMFARGEFAPLLAWLRSRIHVQGKRYRSRDLIRFATGANPSPDHLIGYLQAKYGALYGV